MFSANIGGPSLGEKEGIRGTNPTRKELIKKKKALQSVNRREVPAVRWGLGRQRRSLTEGIVEGDFWVKGEDSNGEGN